MFKNMNIIATMNDEQRNKYALEMNRAMNEYGKGVGQPEFHEAMIAIGLCPRCGRRLQYFGDKMWCEIHEEV